MRKKLERLSEIIILLFAIGVWLFSFYKVASYVVSLKLKVWGFSPSFEYSSWEYPLPKPPFPLKPPCPPPCPPPPCPPPCVTPTPTPTPSPEVTPTPVPTLPPGVTPTPTPTSPPGEGGPPGPAEPSICGATIPPTPNLLSVASAGSGQVDLTWTDVDPATHYSISYGLSPGSYIYGVSDTGNVTSFKVGGLDPAANYCFAIRAVNGCAPSGLSNEICPGAVVGQVLGVSTLGATGDSANQLLQILFIIGCVCFSTGLRVFLPGKNLA